MGTGYAVKKKTVNKRLRAAKTLGTRRLCENQHEQAGYAAGRPHLELFQLQFLLQNRHIRFSLLCCEEVKELSPFDQDF